MERNHPDSCGAKPLHNRAEVALEAAHLRHDPSGLQNRELVQHLSAHAHGNRHHDEVGVHCIGQGPSLIERTFAGGRIDHPHPVALAGQETTDPTSHSPFATHNHCIEGVA